MTTLRIGNKTYSEVAITNEQDIVYKGETYKLVKITKVSSPEGTETCYSLLHREIGNIVEVNLKELQ